MSERFALIIEDNRDLSLIFAESLQAAGFDTDVIQDGQVALTRLQDSKPDIIILDLHLPHVSGKEILEEIRTDERLADTRVIIATADPRMAEMLDDQADLVLLKPISFKQLRDLSERLVPTSSPDE